VGVTIADREGWRPFYQEGDRRLAAIETAFDRWRTSFDEARASGAPPTMADGVNGDELQSVLEIWIEAQDEQAALSQACVLESSDPEECLLGITRADTVRWNSAADDLNRVLTGG
jgi:hypothetical protein